MDAESQTANVMLTFYFPFSLSHFASDASITQTINENQWIADLPTFPFDAAAPRSASLCAFDGRPLLGGIVANN